MVELGGFLAEIEALRRSLRRRSRLLDARGRPRRRRRRAVVRRYFRRRILRALGRSGSLREAARRLGCAPSTLSRNTDPRVAAAVLRFRRPPTPRWWLGDQDRIATRYGEGESVRRIAADYRCAPRQIRDVLRASGFEFTRAKPKPKPCPGWRWSLETRGREPSGVMLPAGRSKRCPECRELARRERVMRLRLRRWEARPEREQGTFSLR